MCCLNPRFSPAKRALLLFLRQCINKKKKSTGFDRKSVSDEIALWALCGGRYGQHALILRLLLNALQLQPVFTTASRLGLPSTTNEIGRSCCFGGLKQVKATYRLSLDHVVGSSIRKDKSKVVSVSSCSRNQKRQCNELR